ncbi:MAG: triose-phosphate isomerase [Firmicutes bacterium]|nr:triose-phosphate isomerase [Bacillota bacterium]MCL1954295.1 triose-phosphate isomerase [Bacillota bacterium]
MRNKIIIGNWKMNKTPSQTESFLQEILPKIKQSSSVVVFCVPFTNLDIASKLLKGTKANLGAQNISWQDSGAYTGEISGAMLKELSVSYALIGHSERRQYFGETDTTVNQRTVAAHRHNIIPVVCVGETLQERQSGNAQDIVTNQIKQALKDITPEQAQNTIVAYEPIWAIGTGVTASANDAQEMLKHIRKQLNNLYGDIADKMHLLYGGSATAANAQELLSQPDLDGLLVGGASLKVEDFSTMANIV